MALGEVGSWMPRAGGAGAAVPASHLRLTGSFQPHAEPWTGGGLKWVVARLQRGGLTWDSGPLVSSHRGGREGASGALGGVVQAPPLQPPAPPIGPESGDSQAEQEGNRSRARQRRLGCAAAATASRVCQHARLPAA